MQGAAHIENATNTRFRPYIGQVPSARIQNTPTISNVVIVWSWFCSRCFKIAKVVSGKNLLTGSYSGYLRRHNLLFGSIYCIICPINHIIQFYFSVWKFCIEFFSFIFLILLLHNLILYDLHTNRKCISKPFYTLNITRKNIKKNA